MKACQKFIFFYNNKDILESLIKSFEVFLYFNVVRLRADCTFNRKMKELYPSYKEASQKYNYNTFCNNKDILEA